MVGIAGMGSSATPMLLEAGISINVGPTSLPASQLPNGVQVGLSAGAITGEAGLPLAEKEHLRKPGINHDGGRCVDDLEAEDKELTSLLLCPSERKMLDANAAMLGPAITVPPAASKSHFVLKASAPLFTPGLRAATPHTLLHVHAHRLWRPVG